MTLDELKNKEPLGYWLKEGLEYLKITDQAVIDKAIDWWFTDDRDIDGDGVADEPGYFLYLQTKSEKRADENGSLFELTRAEVAERFYAKLSEKIQEFE